MHLHQSLGRHGLRFIVVLLAVAAAPAVRGAEPDPVPTFAKDVAPILQERCQVCHRPGGGAPFSLLTYEHSRPWARAIRQRVAAREMPPWHVDKTAGITQYKDDISLSDGQISVLTRWADGGAPLGNPADLPAPKVFPAATTWGLGEPDLVVQPDRDLEMPAKGMDRWIDFEVSLPLTEDRWLKAIEVQPRDPGILHHLAVYFQPPGAEGAPVTASASADVVPSEGGAVSGDLIFTYAPGKGPDVYQPNTGYLVKAGSKVIMAAHYSASGKATSDRASVGLKFYGRGVAPKYRVYSAFVSTNPETLEIPPNSVVTSDVFKRLDKPTRVEAWSPHMHKRGRTITLEAILPNGSRQVLSHVENYFFEWQITYAFADDVAPLLPAGTLLHVITVHDNTKNNRNNPDPLKWIGYGQGSNDEMAAAFVNYVYLDEADFAAQVAAREARAGTPAKR